MSSQVIKQECVYTVWLVHAWRSFELISKYEASQSVYVKAVTAVYIKMVPNV